MRYEDDPVTGFTEAVYLCVRCNDTGWAPDCGCTLDSLDSGHKCPLHPFTRYELAYPRPLYACPCRATNRDWQHTHPTRTTPRKEKRS